MTRPKVHPDKRQRIASACDPCRRRKQKFSTASPDQSHSPQVRGPDTSDFIGRLPQESLELRGGPGKRKGYGDDEDEEEAENHTMTRMLEDSQGRLVFVGDSATLSFLQLLRMIVETVDGPSMFTSDPKRHLIEETKFNIDRNSSLSHLLPDRRTGRILADAFFIHTHGFIDLLDETRFLQNLEAAYDAPLSVTTQIIAQIHLVLAVGMCLAIPRRGSAENDIIEDIRQRFPDQSEVYYLVAGRIKDSLLEMEEADIWTIQSLVLMAFYMLLRTRRSLAYAYTGMAIRSAFALGMHRDEIKGNFSDEEQQERQRVWRTLFVLDRFMSVSLGRPLAIGADMACGETLQPSSLYFPPGKLSPDQLKYAGLAASIESAHTMGTILSKIYQEGRISTKVAQNFSDRCKQWPTKLAPQLHWRNASSDDVRVAIAILHSNLMFCHSIILLTRPFFLYVLSSEIQQSQLDINALEPNSRGKIGRFSDACILASFHTIALVQTAYEGEYLPRLNPLSSYCLFTCGLIVAANEFARPGRHAAAESSFSHAITILEYCGTLDPHAREAAGILTNFRQVIEKRANPPPKVTAPEPPALSSFDALEGLFTDPTMADLLNSSVEVLPNADAPLSSGHEEPFNLDDLRQWPFWVQQPPSGELATEAAGSFGSDHTLVPNEWQVTSNQVLAKPGSYPFQQT